MSMNASRNAGTTSAATPKSAALEHRVSWWWSRDEERFYGPSHSRADAIMDAWADDAEQGAYVCQAVQGQWHTALFDGDDIAERFDDANEEHSDPDGDGPSCLLDQAGWGKLAEQVNQIVRAAVQRAGTCAWAFASQTPSEWVNIPAIWAAIEREDEPASSAEGVAVTQLREGPMTSSNPSTPSVIGVEELVSSSAESKSNESRSNNSTVQAGGGS